MKWYKERVFNYLIHSLLYYVFYKVSGFELAVIIALGQIIGEMHYQEYLKNDDEK